MTAMLMNTHEARLDGLRKHLTTAGLDGFVVPICDEHMSEYVGAYARRLEWLTGFNGSAGTGVVLARRAAMFVDGRYVLQVRDQVDARFYDFEQVPMVTPASWLARHAPDGARIGYDPWLHTRAWVEAASAATRARGIVLVPAANAVDAIWADRPAPSSAPAVPHGIEFAGQSSADKRAAITTWLTDQGCGTVVIAALDSLAWLFNWRGADVDRTPVALAFALLHRDGTADVFIAPEKVTPDLSAHLGQSVRLHPRDGFEAGLAALGGRRVAVDPERSVAAIFQALDSAGATIVPLTDPAVVPKAIKNPIEIAGHRAAQARDNAALSRFLRWLENAGPGAGETEMSAAARLESERRATNLLIDLSFDTISGSGPNGAIMHYRVDPASNRAIAPNSVYLVDSGGQYRDGTTGAQLDVLARQHLWAAGLDYAHGTGHGVGSFLAVHEGPQRIARAQGPQAGTDHPLLPGMIVSNEPGYYLPGQYGIRIENLIVVEPRAIAGAEGEYLGFATLSHVPIDRRLIEPALLDADERAWLDGYHADCRALVGPQLRGDDRAWLEAATQPV